MDYVTIMCNQKSKSRSSLMILFLDFGTEVTPDSGLEVVAAAFGLFLLVSGALILGVHSPIPMDLR